MDKQLLLDFANTIISKAIELGKVAYLRDNQEYYLDFESAISIKTVRDNVIFKFNSSTSLHTSTSINLDFDTAKPMLEKLFQTQVAKLCNEEFMDDISFVDSCLRSQDFDNISEIKFERDNKPYIITFGQFKRLRNEINQASIIPVEIAFYDNKSPDWKKTRYYIAGWDTPQYKSFEGLFPLDVENFSVKKLAQINPEFYKIFCAHEIQNSLQDTLDAKTFTKKSKI